MIKTIQRLRLLWDLVKEMLDYLDIISLKLTNPKEYKFAI